jgi:hypothetical protein
MNIDLSPFSPAEPPGNFSPSPQGSSQNDGLID